MNFAAHFIGRPIATSLLMFALIVAGLLALRELPTAALPSVESPIIRVSTSLAGAAPEIMASSVTNPLEAQLSQIPSLVSISSISSYGNSSITLQFAMSRHIDSAAQDVQAAINAAAGQLPRNLPNPPVYNKVNPADAPILMLAVTSDTLSLPRINDYAETIVGQKLAQVDGVGLVSFGGDQKRALRVRLNPRALANIGLSLDDVRSQIVQYNANAPKGSIDGRYQSFSIGADDQLETADRYLDLILTTVDGSPVRLRDVGSVEESVEDTHLTGWHNQKPAIIISIYRQPSANIIDTVDRIRALLPSLRASLPVTAQLDVVVDRTESIRASLVGVRNALIEGAVIVVLVIFVFLRRLSVTLIPSVVLPLSLVGTFAFLFVAGYSINNLSLMALTIAAGFVVDDAIVMVENIYRHLEAGDDPVTAATLGARQIAFTIVSLTISLVAVFFPLLFMESVVGRLFREFAVTLTVAVVVSAMVSLTFTPMLCSRFLRPLGGDADRPLIGDIGFDRLQRLYMRALDWSLTRPALIHASTLLALAASIAIFIAIPKGLLPNQDNGLIVAVIDAAEDASTHALREAAQQADHTIRADPDVASVLIFGGASVNNPTPNTLQLFIKLKDRRSRSADLRTVIERLLTALKSVMGIRVYMQPSQELALDTRASRTQFQVSLQDVDPEELANWVPRFTEALGARPEVTDVANDQHAAGQQIHLNIDRDRAALRGVSIQAIDDVLYDYFGQRTISTIYGQANQYHVVIESDDSILADRNLLNSVFVRADTGGIVPLSSVVTRTIGTSSLSIAHLGRFPLATVSFNLADGYSLRDAVRAVEETAARIGLPERVSLDFTGAAAEFRSSLRNQPFLIVAAIFVVYIVLGVLYESYIHPITILSTLPSAGVGALSALWLCGYELDLISLIGIILLIGIVKKNAIMMIDFALDAERSRNINSRLAILDACRLRFRPIMMTTLATLLGALPLMLNSSVGFELRRPLGVAIVGGMFVSQVLTLFSTPAMYILFSDLSHRVATIRGMRARIVEDAMPTLSGAPRDAPAE